MIFAIYQEKDCFVLIGKDRPYEIVFIVGEKYIIKSNIKRQSISVEVLTNRKIKQIIKEIEDRLTNSIHFELLDMLEELLYTENIKVDFVQEYLNLHSGEEKIFVQKFINKYNPKVFYKDNNKRRTIR